LVELSTRTELVAFGTLVQPAAWQRTLPAHPLEMLGRGDLIVRLRRYDISDVPARQPPFYGSHLVEVAAGDVGGSNR